MAALLLLPAATVRAQGGGSGSVLGVVVDQSGQPMSGVKISAQSPTQIGGSKVTYTNDAGEFRVVGLIPGTFEVVATVPKMKTVHQKGVKVGLNAAAEVNVIMEVETATEEVKVIEKAPVISTKSAAVKEQYDSEFIDQIPSDFKSGAESVIATSVPGSVVVGFRGARIRGGAVNQTAFQVEGFNMVGQRSTLAGMAGLEIQGAGYGAENATVPGGVVNMVTKSGSNKFELDINAYGEDNHLNYFTDQLDNNDRSYFYVFNPNVSGPIIKDKLWYFFNLEARPEHMTDPVDPLGIAPRTADYNYFSTRGSGKVTWQINQRNKLVSFTNFNMRSNFNNTRGYEPYAEKEAQNRQDDRDIFTGLIWESLLTDTAFLKSQIGVQRFFQQVGPQMCQSDRIACDNVAPVIQTFPRTTYSGNYINHNQTITQKLQFINTLELFPASRALGEHDIRIKNDYYIENAERAGSIPGNTQTFFNGPTPDRQVEFYANDPRLESARYGWFIRSSGSWKNVLSLSDSMRIKRYLTITPGVAFTVARAFNALGETPFNAVALTPHLAAAWDATKDGRTVLRASYNHYVDVDTAGVANFTVGSQVSRTCPWDAGAQAFTTTGCTYAGGLVGRTIGLPCGPTGIDAQGNRCNTKLKVPRTYEYTLGAEREVIPGVALGIDSIYRKFANQYEVLETNRVWNTSGSALDATGGFRNGRNQTVTDIETPKGAYRSYLGNTISIHKREGAMKVNVGYTLSYLQGTVLDGMINAYGDIGGPRDLFLDGYLPDDSRHNIRATATYMWTSWLSTGALYDYHSGRPYRRLFRNVITGGFEDYRARVGISPGTNLNDPADDRESRLPDLQEFGVQFRANWQPLLGIGLETYADVMNILGLRTTIAVVENDGPLWGSPTLRSKPFRMRIGARFRF
jgi:hypothetical protein